MSSSWSCESELRKLATEFFEKGTELENAANCLRDLREAEGLENRYKDAKEWAKNWMNRK